MTKAFLFLHILAAIIGFGGVIIAGPGLSRAVRIKGEEGRAVFESSSRQVNLAYLFIYAVFVFGIVLVFVGDIEFSDTWLSISMGLYIVIIILSLTILMPAIRHMGSLFETQTADSLAKLDELGKRIVMISGINNLLMAAILGLMIWQP